MEFSDKILSSTFQKYHGQFFTSSISIGKMNKVFITSKEPVLYAPFDVVLSDTEVLQPDIIFVSKGKLGLITEKNLRGAPDLAIEILSTSTKERDKLVKKKLYMEYGVKEFWMVDPDKKAIEVMVLKETGLETFGIYFIDDKLISPLLKGFRLDLKEVCKVAKATKK